MKKTRSTISILLTLFLFLNFPVKANSQHKDILDDLDYPELQVVPLASERIREERKEEDQSWWYMLWPFQISAISTMGIGLLAPQYLRNDLTVQQQTDARNKATAIFLLGTAWLAETYIVSARKPYNEGYKKLSKIKGNSKKSRLFRERIAEETLEKPAKLIQLTKYFSVATNLIASLLLIDQLNDKGKALAGLAAYASFAPLIFENPYVYNYKKHKEYKKKIYAPLSSLFLKKEPLTGTYASGIALRWYF